MKRLLLAGCLSCLLLLALSACARNTAASEDDNIVYGQVVKTDENQITIESGEYTYGGSFQGDGTEESYTLPENVFYDDFKAGDIVSILCDGQDATAVSNVEDVDYKVAASENSGSAESASEKAAEAVADPSGRAQLTADGEPVTVNDESYQVGADSGIGLLALNDDGRINMSRSSVSVLGKNSCGLMAFNGGVISGEQVNLTSSGENGVAAAALNRSSVIELSDSTMQTSSAKSPCVLSAGNVSLNGVSATVQKSNGVTVLPGGVVNLKNSSMVSGGDAAIELCDPETLQKAAGSGSSSGRSGNADQSETADRGAAFAVSSQSGKAKIMADSSSLEAVSGKALLQVTGIEGFVKMMNTDLTLASGAVLADVKKNQKGQGGKLLLYGVNQDYSGDITCDDSSKVKLVLTEGSSYSGCFDAKGSASYSKVYLSRNSAWNVTGDSHVSSLRNGNKKCSNIKSNGHKIYYDKNREANDWLGGKTVSLPGGGTLQPE